MLNDNRTNIVDAFTALRRLADVASHVLSETKDDFAADFKDLYPGDQGAQRQRRRPHQGLDVPADVPVPLQVSAQAVRGDYLNVFVTFDLTLRRLGESVFTTSALDPNMKHMCEVINPPDFLTGAMANLSGQAADPFKIPPGTATQTSGDRADDRPADPHPARDLRGRHRAVRRRDRDLLPAPARQRWVSAPTR